MDERTNERMTEEETTWFDDIQIEPLGPASCEDSLARVTGSCIRSRIESIIKP